MFHRILPYFHDPVEAIQAQRQGLNQKGENTFLYLKESWIYPAHAYYSVSL
jgi:hypothetical protein